MGIKFPFFNAFIDALTCEGESWELNGTMCYKIIRNYTNGVSHQEGLDLCKAENSAMVMPKIQEENEAVKNLEKRYKISL